jgi:PPM family protein phosphatase
MSALNKNLIFEVGSHTNPGNVKEHNEDEIAYFETVNGDIWVVCDGVNGEQGGAALAAKLATKSIGEYFQNKKYSNPLNALNNSILYANHQVYSHVEKNKHLLGMATTIVVILVRDDKMYYAYAGNSRIYIRRKDKLQGLTKDHTIAQQLFDKGEITAEEAINHPKKDEVYNLLGVKKDFKFSTCKNPISLLEDDIILLNTDGLTNQVSEEEINKVISDPDVSIQHSSLQLVELANKAGGTDNTSLHLIRFFKPDENIKPQKTSKVSNNKNSSLKLLPYILIGVVLAIIIYYSYDLFFSTSSPQLTSSEPIIEEKKPTKELTDVVEYDKPDSDLLNNEEVSKEEKDNSNVDEALFAEDKIEESLSTNAPIYLEYNIGKGENFYRLGLRFNVTIKELEDANHIVSTQLQANQKVKIPLKAIHIVRKGEVISSIADKYDCSVLKIKKANKLESESIREGQELYIPKTSK